MIQNRWAQSALLSVFLAVLLAAPVAAQQVQYYKLPDGEGPHDVAPAPDGAVWYTGQAAGVLGRLDPASGRVDRIPLGEGSAPHGVVVGPDGAAWVTDGGLNAILRVDAKSKAVKRWPLPQGRAAANLNTPAIDGSGRVWFTGQDGIYGRLDPRTDDMQVWDAPRGRGPYGITATPQGDIWFVSLAGSYLAKPDLQTGAVTPIEPSHPGSGTRRVWSDSSGRLWVSEWNAGTLSVYDPQKKVWQTWGLPGEAPKTYAVFVDDKDKVWMSDFSANAILRFDPETQAFSSFPSSLAQANVRQLAGRPGEVWGAESGTDRLVVVRNGTASQ